MKILTIISKMSFVLFIACILTACIPKYDKIYNGPEVSGKVIRLSDFTPIQNTKISYGDIYDVYFKNENINVAISDENGFFTLKPNFSRQFKLQMPAHMLTEIPMYTYGESIGNSVDIVVSKWLNREYEQYDVGIIIIDDNANEYAQPLFDNSIDLKVLSNTFQPHNFLGECNYNDGIGAINKLNIVRKLAQNFKEQQLAGNHKKMNELKNLMLDVKGQTIAMWEYFISNCNYGEQSSELKKLKTQVFGELDGI